MHNEISYEDYRFYGGRFDIDVYEEFSFKALEVLHSITNRYYIFQGTLNYSGVTQSASMFSGTAELPHSHGEQFRRAQFKKAFAAQVDYFHRKGGDSLDELSEPGAISIGRTSMQMGYSGSAKSPQPTLVSPDAIMFLRDTGLLYKGVPSW